MKTAIVVVALALVGCGGREPLAVRVDAATSAPAWMRSPDLAARTIAAAEEAARAWGGTTADLDGWTIAWRPEDFDCGGLVYGCTHHDTRTVDLAASRHSIMGDPTPVAYACPEMTGLAHEIGHVIIGDGGHADPRWHDPAFWRGVFASLQAVIPAWDAECLARAASGEL